MCKYWREYINRHLSFFFSISSFAFTSNSFSPPSFIPPLTFVVICFPSTLLHLMHLRVYTGGCVTWGWVTVSSAQIFSPVLNTLSNPNNELFQPFLDFSRFFNRVSILFMMFPNVLFIQSTVLIIGFSRFHHFFFYLSLIFTVLHRNGYDYD